MKTFFVSVFVLASISAFGQGTGCADCDAKLAADRTIGVIGSPTGCLECDAKLAADRAGLNRGLPPVYQQGYAVSSFVAYQPAYDPYYSGYGYAGYYPALFLDRCLAGGMAQAFGISKVSQPRECVMAEVKFDTSGKGMDKAEVFVDGFSAGEIGKYSHRMTSGLSLEANTEYTLEVVWETPKGTKTMIRRIKPNNIRFQDGAYWYPVSPEKFSTTPYGRSVTPVIEPVSGKDLVMGKPK